MKTLHTLDASGAPTPATYDEIMHAARAALSRRVRRGAPLESPAIVADFLTSKLADRPHEVFCALYLDARHRLIEFRELFTGTIDGANVYPREVVRDALAYNAASVIFAHNHPSGVAEPSSADELITKRLRNALALVDIRVLDHVIIAGDEHTSLSSRGLL